MEGTLVAGATTVKVESEVQDMAVDDEPDLEGQEGEVGALSAGEVGQSSASNT